MVKHPIAQPAKPKFAWRPPIFADAAAKSSQVGIT
jgi:hypothetical protein